MQLSWYQLSLHHIYSCYLCNLLGCNYHNKKKQLHNYMYVKPNTFLWPSSQSCRYRSARSQGTQGIREEQEQPGDNCCPIWCILWAAVL